MLQEDQEEPLPSDGMFTVWVGTFILHLFTSFPQNNKNPSIPEDDLCPYFDSFLCFCGCWLRVKTVTFGTSSGVLSLQFNSEKPD